MVTFFGSCKAQGERQHGVGNRSAKGLGDFCPDGAFEGGDWYGRLLNHFYRQPPDVQKALFDTPLEPLDALLHYNSFVSHKFISEWGVRRSRRPEDPPLTPILDHELPMSFDTVKGYKTPTSHLRKASMAARTCGGNGGLASS